MKSTASPQHAVRTMAFLALLGSSALFAAVAQADPIPPGMQAKVEHYKQKLAEWAANPVIIAAVKEANAKGPGGMDNGVWNDLNDNDPKVKALQTSAAGKQLSKWEADKNISKLYVRDDKGNLAASSNKPLLFNNFTRPQFTNPFKGKAWSANEMKPDPTTQVMSVQIAVPVMDGGKPIGVMNSSVSAK
ncbi:MAG: PDC sensor domain-containing protein [Sulfuricellaceae bacterium]|nr:PDC sensor domain-containing protein [Sulfuricellaceae bacterium]